MKDFSRRCEPGIYAFIARGPYAGLVVRVLGVAWHHVHEGYTWRVSSTFNKDFTCVDSCLTPITGVDLNKVAQYKGEGK